MELNKNKKNHFKKYNQDKELLSKTKLIIFKHHNNHNKININRN